MGNWEANIYTNENLKTSMIVSNNMTLNEVRESLHLEDAFFFISRNRVIIEHENNYKVKHIRTNDPKGGYKIDLMTSQYYQANKNGLVKLYINNFPHCSVRYKRNMPLREIKQLGGIDEENIIINNDDNTKYFLDTENMIIFNEENIVAKDIVRIENGKKIIHLRTKKFHLKQEIIDYCEMLKSLDKINWFNQDRFFQKLQEFAGKGVTDALQDELINDMKEKEKINDREYIEKFLALLMKKEERSSRFSTFNSGY